MVSHALAGLANRVVVADGSTALRRKLLRLLAAAEAAAEAPTVVPAAAPTAPPPPRGATRICCEWGISSSA